MTSSKAVRIGLVVTVAALMVWLVLLVGIPGVSRYSRPATALSWHAGDARAQAELSESAMQRARDARTLSEAISLARSALARDITVVPALRTLGLGALARGEAERSARLFKHAAELSSRDLPTRIWLIEERVSANDIPGAIHHYDIALRTSPRAPDILFPVLIAATADPVIVDHLVPVLANRPPWARAFISRAVEKGPSSESVVRLVKRLAAVNKTPERDIMQQLLVRLTREYRFQGAWDIYRLAGGRRAPIKFGEIASTPFGNTTGLQPFDWMLASEPSFGADRFTRPGAPSETSLQLRANGEGLAARQLMVLSAGSYKLVARIGDVAKDPMDRPFWSVTCATQGGAALLRLNFSAARSEGVEQSAIFRVPEKGCTGQWLDLVLRANLDQDGPQGWVDFVQIKRI